MLSPQRLLRSAVVSDVDGPAIGSSGAHGGGAPVQDARACSAVLKVRSLAHHPEHRAGGSSSTRSGAGRLPSTGGGCTEGGRFRLLQNGREDKCVVSHERVRPKPTNLLELGDEPTSAPTGCPDIG